MANPILSFKKCSKRGFTITELLIGLVIMAAVMTPLIFMMTSSKKGLMSEEKYFQALFLAQKVTEIFHSELSRDPKFPLKAPVFEPPFDDFTCSVESKPVNNDDMFQQATVAIHWKEMNRDRTFQLPFQYSKRFSLEIGYRLEYPWEDED